MHGKKDQCKAWRIPESQEADGQDKGENRPGLRKKLCPGDTLATAQTGGGLLMQETARINYRNILLSIIILLIGIGSGINAGISHKADLANGISSTAQAVNSLGPQSSVMSVAPVVSYNAMNNTVAFAGNFLGGTIVLVIVIAVLLLISSQLALMGARGI